MLSAATVYGFARLSQKKRLLAAQLSEPIGERPRRIFTEAQQFA
jgi:hypothetical protein